MIGGLGAIQTAMVTGALPFSAVMVLTGISLIKAICRDCLRQRLDQDTVAQPAPGPAE